MDNQRTTTDRAAKRRRDGETDSRMHTNRRRNRKIEDITKRENSHLRQRDRHGYTLRHRKTERLEKLKRGKIASIYRKIDTATYLDGETDTHRHRETERLRRLKRGKIASRLPPAASSRLQPSQPPPPSRRAETKIFWAFDGGKTGFAPVLRGFSAHNGSEL